MGVMPLIRKSSASGHHPRIVIVSSMAHQMARQGINFEDINYDNDFNTMKAYGISKLANVLHAEELANRLNNTGISVYVLHPGVINTELSRHIHKKIPSFIACCMIPFFGWIIKSPFHGAQTTLYCTLDDKIECESGKYYSGCAVAPTLTSHAEDMVAAKKLWEISVHRPPGLKLSRRELKSSFVTKVIDMTRLSVIGGSPKVLTIEYVGSSRECI